MDMTMVWICRYLFYFFVFSFIGWIYECTYCTITTGKWQNRGFLFGPICPIYGSAVVLMMMLFRYSPHLAGDQPWWKIFLICYVGSAVLEFVTSWVLEKAFHAVWWDYSDMWLNVQGRICPFASCGFGAAGIVFVKVIFPWIATIQARENPVLQLMAVIVMAALMGADLALTVETLIRLVDHMEKMESSFNARMEKGVDLAKAGAALVQQGPGAVAEAAKNAAMETAANAKQAVTEAAGAARQAAMTGAGEARLQAALAEKELQDRLRQYTEDFSFRENYHLRSIAGFRTEGTRHMSDRFKTFLAERKKNKEDKTSSPEDRNVKRMG